MRITLVAQSCDNRTGIGRVVLNLAGRFSGLAHEVTVVAQSAEGLDGVARVSEVASFPLSNALNKIAFMLDSSKVVAKGSADIVNAFGVGRGANIVTAGSCHKAGIDIRTGFQNKLVWRRNFGLYDRISLADERALFTSPRTRKIIAVSRLVKEQIIRYYHVATDKIVVIPNGVDQNFFRATDSRESLRRQLDYKEDDVVLLFVGNEFDRKGLEIVIRSLSHLRAKLLVIGGAAAVPYARMARELGVHDRVKFMGMVPGPERMFAAADVFVLPTLYEPFGMVLIEAMAAGVPVVTSKACGAVEDMENGRDGLYLNDPLSIDEFTTCVRRIMDDHEFRRQLIHHGREKAAEFDWKIVTAKYLDVYREVGGD